MLAGSIRDFGRACSRTVRDARTLNFVHILHPCKRQMDPQHALPPALFFEITYPCVEQIFKRDDAYQLSRVFVIDHRKS